MKQKLEGEKESWKKVKKKMCPVISEEAAHTSGRARCWWWWLLWS